MQVLLYMLPNGKIDSINSRMRFLTAVNVILHRALVALQARLVLELQV